MSENQKVVEAAKMQFGRLLRKKLKYIAEEAFPEKVMDRLLEVEAMIISARRIGIQDLAKVPAYERVLDAERAMHRTCQNPYVAIWDRDVSLQVVSRRIADLRRLDLKEQALAALHEELAEKGVPPHYFADSG